MTNQPGGGSGEQPADGSVCRARTLGAGGLVECLAEVKTCQWHLPFGMGVLCKHPLNREIARGELSSGWSGGNSR